MALKDADIKRMRELVALLNKYNTEYYINDNPSISDNEYDSLVRELRSLEAKYPSDVVNDSPTKEVGGLGDTELQKINHEVPMMSLQDVFSFDDIYEFDDRIKKLFPNTTYSVELKIDGIASSVHYKNGLLVLGATRGNGVIGENITKNVSVIDTIPKTLTKALSVEVRGEVLMYKSVLSAINESRRNNNLPEFANCRNAAGGSLRQLDENITRDRHLAQFAYTLVNPKLYGIHTQIEAVKFLKDLGFNTNKEIRLCKNVSEIIDYINEYDEKRKTLDYPIDGIVIKVNELDTYDTIGYTVKVPKWAVAYKYTPDVATTKLNEIIFTVGRTGIITPNASFDPVQLSGTTVSRATLNNEAFILERDIRVGDYIKVRKAGEIIPEVIGVDESRRDNSLVPFKMIEVCPSCGHKLSKRDGEAEHYCINPNCGGRILEGIIHFASRGCMDIDGLGEKQIELLYTLGYIKNISDIYTLNNYQDEIMELNGFGKKKVSKMIDAINQSKTQTLDRFIFGLGIRFVGAKASKNLASTFKSLDRLINATYEELIVINDLGEVMAKSIVDFFNDSDNLDLINRLINLGLSLTVLKSNESTIFEGKTFVLTGTLPTYSRDEASAIIESLGGVTSSSVSKKTSYVLAGENAGSKLEKAKSLGVVIISEEEFKEMVKDYI